MSTEYPSKNVIETATVAIFSPDMKKLIVVVNIKLNRILPPGGKFDGLKDTDSFAAALREIAEEIRLALFPGTGNFLNKYGYATEDVQPVMIEEFEFINKSGLGRDSLYFFRLRKIPGFELIGDTKGFFLSKNELLERKMLIGEKEYEIFFPESHGSKLKEVITDIMKD